MQRTSLLSKLVKIGAIGVVAAAAAKGTPTLASQPDQPRPVRGGGQPAQPSPQPGQPAANPLAGEPSGPVFSVQFPGGTVEEYVAAVQAAAKGQAVNVLVPEEASRVVLPRISLRDVNVGTALEAIRWAFPEGSEHRFGVEPFGENRQAYAFRYQRTRGAASPFPPGQPQMQMVGPAATVAVYSLRDLTNPPQTEEGRIEPVSAEILLTAVEAALNLAARGEDGPELRYHEESGLLIVKGQQDQVQTVRMLLDAIRTDAHMRWATARDIARSEAQRQYRRQRLELEVEMQQNEVRAAEQRLARLSELSKSGAISSEELLGAEHELKREMGRLRLVELELSAPEGSQPPAPRPSGGRPAAGGPSPAPDDNATTAVLLQTIADLQRRLAELESERAKSRPRDNNP